MTVAENGTQPEAPTFEETVTVGLKGGHTAVMDGDPPWSFMHALSGMSDGRTGDVQAIAPALASVVKQWDVRAKVGGSAQLPNGADKPTMVSWSAGDVPPVCLEGVLSLATSTIVEMALRYGQTFQSLPKAPGGN